MWLKKCKLNIKILYILMEEIELKINEIENKLRSFKLDLNMELALIDNNFCEIRESLIEVKSILEMLVNKYKHLNILLNRKYD